MMQGTLDPLETTESRLVELEDESAVSFRRNPNKPPETTHSQSLPDQDNPSNITLDPKSDDETADGEGGELRSTSVVNETDETQTNSSSQSRRHTLRRSSIDSDVSLLSRESDDAPLLS